MACLYCGKEIGPFRLLRDDEFCSSRHRKEYRERLARGLLQAQTTHVHSTKVAGFEEVLRTCDIAMEPLASVVKVDSRTDLRAVYSAFPLTVTEIAGSSLMPLDLRGVPGVRVVESPYQNGTPAKDKPGAAEKNGRNSMPSFLIPSPALNSRQSAELEPHNPAGAAADLHVCSSPDPLIALPENLKLPVFCLSLDLSVEEKSDEKRKRTPRIAAESSEVAAVAAEVAQPAPVAEVPPPVVTAAQPTPAPNPREVEAVPFRDAQPSAWPAYELALPAPDPAVLFGAAAEAPAVQIAATTATLEIAGAGPAQSPRRRPARPPPPSGTRANSRCLRARRSGLPRGPRNFQSLHLRPRAPRAIWLPARHGNGKRHWRSN